jgi:hypothetical protein
MADFKGKIPESWLCVDCGTNTAPGLLNRAEMEKAAEEQGEAEVFIDNQTEVYTVRDAVWKAAGMEPMGGCLCIGCLEKRLDRVLKPEDFKHGHELDDPKIPGTSRLKKRRKD